MKKYRVGFQRQMKLMVAITLSMTFSVTFAQTTDTKIAKELQAIVSEEHANSGLVSLGAAISKNRVHLATAVYGERETKSGVPVSIDDKWHIGSVTKSMTATMIARLVERGVLQWDTTVGDILTDSRVRPQWRDATLSQLLTHTGGAETDFPWRIQSLYPKEGTERDALRKEEVLKILEEKPDYKPGTDFEYSNVGYTIAAVLATTKTGKTWEDLIREEVFQPLELSSGGFGPPVDVNETMEQPRGHKITWFSGPEAVTTDTDNSPIMGPAGMIHMSLKDLSAYANEHLLGSQGKSELLSAQTYQRLHEPGMEDYAYGWVLALDDSWANEHKVLYHNGSNRFWFALLVIIPELQISIVVTTNYGDLKPARKSAWNIVKHMTAFLMENPDI